MRQMATVVVIGILAVKVGAAVPTEGLVLYYPFSGHAGDGTASGNNAAVHGATLAPDRFGNADWAYHLNGSGAYIESDFPLPDMESLTVSCWFELDSWVQANWTQPQALFFEGDDSGGRDLALLLQNGLHWVLKSGETLSYGSWLPELGAWTHLVCVADETAQKIAMWVNGRKVKEGSFAGGANRGFHSRFNLGRRPGGFNDWHIAGSIDEVRVYDRALSDLEIAQLHSAELGNARRLKIATETVRVTMGLEPGKHYILQYSLDLAAWSDFGASFVAQAAEESVVVPVNESRRFWRVVSEP